MIGIIASNDEKKIVHEFFQLFKTPWEFVDEKKVYEVVITTRPVIPDNCSKLCLIFCSKENREDIKKTEITRKTAYIILDNAGLELPIYGKLTIFKNTENPLAWIKSSSEVTGYQIKGMKPTIFRFGYDLFDEILYLITDGQPAANAHIPTLDRHIHLLRHWILIAGIPVIEIPPQPAGFNFFVCLTHDVDFLEIRRHKFDHTMGGFIYRATVGSLFRFIKGELSFAKLMKNWKSVIALPLVYLGLKPDYFWQFDRYMEIEHDLKATYFLIPYKNRPGKNLTLKKPEHRAVKYDVDDIRSQIKTLQKKGFEIGLHGIDAWHSIEMAKEERERLAGVTGSDEMGVRIHWLCFDRHSLTILDEAGFCYDSTFGYNETVGYRGGTTQVFRPPGAKNILELPLHLQDMALLSHNQLGLNESQAFKLFLDLVHNATQYGGVLTILWHMRSLAPERLWGDIYIRLIDELKGRKALFATASRAVKWFRNRRALFFEEAVFTDGKLRLRMKYSGNRSNPNLKVRVHIPCREANPSNQLEHKYIDIPWNGKKEMEISCNLHERQR